MALHSLRWLALLIGCGLLVVLPGRAAEDLPNKPTRYVSDRAFALDEPQIAALNTQLENFERETSNQIVVAIFLNLPANAEIAQYSTQVFNAWGVGQKDKDNGAILFIFKNDRKLFISTGRGLEGALPDALCQQIIANEIVPRFKQNDFSGGIQAGVTAMIAASKNEYKGTGKTVGDQPEDGGSAAWIFIIFICLWGFMVLRGSRRNRGTMVDRRGYTTWSSGGWGGGFGGGGGGGGGFSGGGGSSSGGGAGGSW